MRITVRNWDKWQSYRKDRGTPPWIKIHRQIMSNPDWANLSDAEKGHLISMWIIAADKGGEIPADPIILRKVCQLDDVPNVNKFIQLGFLASSGCQDDVTVASSGCQDDAPEKRRGEEKREEKSIGATRSARFTPPALSDVEDYCRQRNNSVDPIRWFNYYSANGWMVGKNKMKDWQAAVRTWEQRQAQTKVDDRPAWAVPA